MSNQKQEAIAAVGAAHLVDHSSVPGYQNDWQAHGKDMKKSCLPSVSTHLPIACTNGTHLLPLSAPSIVPRASFESCDRNYIVLAYRCYMPELRIASSKCHHDYMCV